MWKAWSSMPHCILWTDSDWAFALLSIELAALFHETCESRYAVELRNREKIMGTTADYRRGLRIRYIDAPAKKGAEENGADAKVTSLDAYRNL